MALLGLRARVAGALSAAVERFGEAEAVTVRIASSPSAGALSPADGETLASAAAAALDLAVPFVFFVTSAGVAVDEGIDSLHAWGKAAGAVSACSGIVPVVMVVDGPAVSGSALLLGLADVVVMTRAAYAFVTSPATVSQVTGVAVGVDSLGGVGVHLRRTGVAALQADDVEAAETAVGELLSLVPPHADRLAPRRPCDDPVGREAPELRELIPASSTGSYDVRTVARAVLDDGDLLELRQWWAPQLVTGLGAIGGVTVGVVANQPQAMAGTLDIPASQKGARFVAFCDSFGIPILTLVDTPGFLPGKDIEWRGMIRHGAQLAFAYAEATVPRVCVILRKAYGGAYIVMDSATMGSDLCLAWPTAEVAVMGARGAVQILHRRADPERMAAAEADYAARYLSPWVAAERGLVDAVIDPALTRPTVASALQALASKKERLVARKHSNTPL